MKKGTMKSGNFLQRTCRFFGTADGLPSDRALCLAADGEAVYIGTDRGLAKVLADGCCVSWESAPVTHIFVWNGKVLFSIGNALCALEQNEIVTEHCFTEPITGIAGDSRLFVITAGCIYDYADGEVRSICGTELPAEGLSAAGSTVVSFSGRSLMLLKGKRAHWRCIFPEHTQMPDMEIHDAAIDPATGFIWLGTDRGTMIYDNGCGWYGAEEIAALPAEETYHLAFSPDGTVAAATAAGLVLIEEGGRHYLPAKRWSCAEKLNAVAFSGSAVWTASDCGVSCIQATEMTLENKAKEFFRLGETYYTRLPGFHTSLHGVENHDLATGQVNITDNDGLWTQVYLAANCYAFAVTGDEAYRAAARRCKEAMVLLTKISGIPGFTARAVRYPHEEGYGTGTGAPGDEWHPAPDGSCEWLGETSSDEMTGHFFGFSLYYDLCADEAEKEELRTVLCGIVDHILSHGYRLCDIDGLPTTWACWAPEELNDKNMWLWEKCLNSLQILTFLDVAYHVSGKERYRSEFRHLAFEKHYLLNAAHEKKADGRVTHIDDQLGFLCMATILRLEQEPGIRRYLLAGLRDHWNYERDEHNPFWNLIFGAFTSEDCDLDLSLRQLRDFPLDLTHYELHNSKRKDLVYDDAPLRWGGERQLKTALPWDARQLCNNDTNPYRVDFADRHGALSPHIFLLPYWFGRYYGLIEES